LRPVRNLLASLITGPRSPGQISAIAGRHSGRL